MGFEGGREFVEDVGADGVEARYGVVVVESVEEEGWQEGAEMGGVVDGVARELWLVIC